MGTLGMFNNDSDELDEVTIAMYTSEIKGSSTSTSAQTLEYDFLYFIY